MGVGNGFKKTEIPPMLSMGVIPIPGRRRVAKPFLTSEIRYHAKWLAERLQDAFGIEAGLSIMRGLEAGINQGKGDRSQSEKWIEEHRNILEQDGELLPGSIKRQN